VQIPYTVAVPYSVAVKYRVRVKGKWVVRTRMEKRTRRETRYEDETRYKDGDITKPETVVQTPLDGTMTLTLARPAGTSMVLSDPVSGAQLAPPSPSQIVHGVCGYRAFKLTLIGSTAGPFTVAITKP
jgi:hypothetical protein